MPATPSPPGARRRRNLDQAKWKQLQPANVRAPALPTKKPTWRKETRGWWRTIWASPMASMWEPADVSGLIRLARLKDDVDRGTAPATALSAMQQLEDRYGLNPKSRRALQWEVTSRLTSSEPPPVPEPPGSNVRRLRAVDARAVAGA